MKGEIFEVMDRYGFWALGAIATSFVLTAMPATAAVLVSTTDATIDEVTEETLDMPSVRSVVDIPEEILRTEIITGARSPVTGEVLSAAEYAELQAELEDSAGTAFVSEDIRYLIFLLQLRRAVRPIIPFL
ncbi:MAG: hypothetical protein WA783_22880 [Phormidesmis sp.]